MTKLPQIAEAMQKLQLIMEVLPPIKIQPLTLQHKEKDKDGKEQLVKVEYIAILLPRPQKNVCESEREQ